MDYLNADENGVCPNGIQLSWTVTSCDMVVRKASEDGNE